jgi:ATP-dependent helicase Lhr and Lhr-like helicase
MVAEGILARTDGRLGLGQRGERLYGFRNFTELCSVFSTPRILTVLHGTREIGSIEAAFLEGQELGSLTFTLAARTWHVVHADVAHGVVRVEPAAEGKHARWSGRPTLLGRELCQAIRDVLVTPSVDAWWSQRARSKLDELRTEHAFLADGDAPLEPDAGGYRLWNFEGGRRNNVLAKTLEGILGEKVTTGNLAIGFRGVAAKSVVAIRQAMDRLHGEGRPNHADALAYAVGLENVRLSKFQPCLPAKLEAAYLAEMLTDRG